MNDSEYRTSYIRQNTRITHYLPFPIFLLELDISQSAKILYALLLNRATLSQKNNWFDESGRVYIMYAIEDMAKELHKSKTTVKAALYELEQADLLERKRLDFGKPNVILLKMIHPLSQWDGNPAYSEPENSPTDGPFSDLLRDGKLTPNNYSNQTEYISPDGSKEKRTAYGRYQNVLLSEEEYSTLQTDYGSDLDRFIEELSSYLAATGKTYENYEAGIRLWASKERKTPGHKTENQDYSCEEGESY